MHLQTRKGLSCIGQVEADGWITTEHGRNAEPSPALRDLVGSQIDGWAYWTHEPSSESLRQLREEAASPGGIGERKAVSRPVVSGRSLDGCCHHTTPTDVASHAGRRNT